MEIGGEVKNSVEEEPGGYCRHSQSVTKDFVQSVEGLSAFLPFKKEELFLLKKVESLYHLRIPFYYLSLIKDFSDSNDPIRKQSIPAIEELDQDYHAQEDPLGEVNSSPCSCLVHRYPDRVLLLVTNQCFMYCRHCTRKRIWGKKVKQPIFSDIIKALSYIRENKNIREVVISGGDPLTLPTEYLAKILSGINACSNIEVIRIGTRAPVVFPQRIDQELCGVLERYKNIWINVQFNHPREITPQAALACRKLQNLGIPISNQSVLLRGINDNHETMIELCRKLQAIQIRPYYLFQCDPVTSIAHFRTSIWKGQEIIEKMRGVTSGMCIPNFVIDGINGKGKVPFGPNYLASETDNGVILKNYKGDLFFYHDEYRKASLIKTAKNNSAIKTIGITFNLKTKSKDDECEEYDDIETIESLAKEIEKLGFKAMLFEQNNFFLREIQDKRPDFVLNIAEGRGSLKGRESQVPAVLESLGIPYFGSGPVALGITLDKYLTHQILKSENIPVPWMAVVKNSKDIDSLSGVFKKKKLFIVKPRWEGSSKGIFLNSVIDNFEDFKERALNIFSKYFQPAVLEEFLEKDEITAGIRGNDNLNLLGMMKIELKDKAIEHFVYSLEVKREWKNRVEYKSEENISQEVKVLIEKYAFAAYKVLELRDAARIDFRLDSAGIPEIIDVNPLPGLSPEYGDLPILYRLRGGNYSGLIKILLEESFARQGINQYL
ncbi:MAG: KamA family radical SAM protein [Candidatus Omnitrophota bacterium]